MYSTCIYCHGDLGKNEVIEHFPIGRRLAFDAAKGRLWAICRRCERWNLSPVEERWEAIEECERLFRDTRLRVSTDNVGLARMGEGLELVRIGQPQRPEMAAWRYGDQFGRRRRRYYTVSGLAVGALVGFYVIGPAAGLWAAGSGTGAWQLFNAGQMLYRKKYHRVQLPMPGAAKPMVVEAEHVPKVKIVPDSSEQGWALDVPYNPKTYAVPDRPGSLLEPRTPVIFNSTSRKPTARFSGDAALHVAGKILPKTNASGAGRDEVKEAVSVLEKHGDARELFRRWSGSARTGGQTLKGVAKPIRLALEMAAHEDTERRALEGELAMLEAAWKEAEDVAAISDSLILPADVDTWLAKLKLRKG